MNKSDNRRLCLAKKEAAVLGGKNRKIMTYLLRIKENIL